MFRQSIGETPGVAASQVGLSDETHPLLKHSHKLSKTFSGHLTHSVKPRGPGGGVLTDLWLPHPSTLAPGEGPGGSRLPIDGVAQDVGTIGYELMCALAARVPVPVQP